MLKKLNNYLSPGKQSPQHDNENINLVLEENCNKSNKYSSKCVSSHQGEKQAARACKTDKKFNDQSCRESPSKLKVFYSIKQKINITLDSLSHHSAQNNTKTSSDNENLIRPERKQANQCEASNTSCHSAELRSKLPQPKMICNGPLYSSTPPSSFYKLPEVVLSSNQSLDKASNMLKIPSGYDMNPLLSQRIDLMRLKCSGINDVSAIHPGRSKKCLPVVEPCGNLSLSSRELVPALNTPVLESPHMKSLIVATGNMSSPVSPQHCPGQAFVVKKDLQSPRQFSNSAVGGLALNSVLSSSMNNCKGSDRDSNPNFKLIGTNSQTRETFHISPFTNKPVIKLNIKDLSSPEKRMYMHSMPSTIDPPTSIVKSVPVIPSCVLSIRNPVIPTIESKIKNLFGNDASKITSNSEAKLTPLSCVINSPPPAIKMPLQQLTKRIPRSFLCNSNLPAIREDPIGGPAPVCTEETPRVEKTWALHLQEISRHGWYWGPISRADAEVKLCGQLDGVFLVRDSTKETFLLSLSFRSGGKTYHTRIEYRHGLFSLCPTGKKTEFRSLPMLIDTVIENSNSGAIWYTKPRQGGALPAFAVQLRHSLSRFSEVRPLQHLCRFSLLQQGQYDSVASIYQLQQPPPCKSSP